MSVIRNILVILAFHYVILTCTLGSVFEVLRFISLLIIQLIWDETTSKSLHWFLGFFFNFLISPLTSKTENFWVHFCFSFSGMTGLNITEKDKIAQLFKVDEKWGDKFPWSHRMILLWLCTVLFLSSVSYLHWWLKQVRWEKKKPKPFSLSVLIISKFLLKKKKKGKSLCLQHGLAGKVLTVDGSSCLHTTCFRNTVFTVTSTKTMVIGRESRQEWW